MREYGIRYVSGWEEHFILLPSVLKVLWFLARNLRRCRVVMITVYEKGK